MIPSSSLPTPRTFGRAYCHLSAVSSPRGRLAGVLNHTFLHLPHIGPRREMDLWLRGIVSWEDLEHHLLARPRSLLLPGFPSRIERTRRGSPNTFELLDALSAST